MRRWNKFRQNAIKVFLDLHLLIGLLLLVGLTLIGFWQVITRMLY
jgi:TRAP-type C4-dicarboxylate transport system permease small subunit